MKNLKKATLVLSMFAMVFMLFSCEKEDAIDPATQAALNQQKLLTELVEKISTDPESQDVITKLYNSYMTADQDYDLLKAQQELEDYQNNVLKNKFVALRSLSEESYGDVMLQSFNEIVSISFYQNYGHNYQVVESSQTQAKVWTHPTLAGSGRKFLVCTKDFPCCLFATGSYIGMCFKANCVEWPSHC